MEYYASKDIDYILAYTITIPGHPPIKSTDRALLFPMGSDVLFDTILEEMVHTRVDKVVLHRGDIQVEIQSKCLILPKRPPIGPCDAEIQRLNKVPL